MDQRSVKSVAGKSRHELRTTGIVLLVMLLAYWISCQWPVRDLWSGLWYQKDVQIENIEASLDLTDTGRRIFAATHPAIESRDAFNEHCDSHKTEVSLLGCYSGGRIYVYEITLPELADSNKVTMAHELLHAAWERMSSGERETVSALLEQVRSEHAEWFAEELALYSDSDKLEETWTRAGTKLRDLPAELENYYRKYFNNRQAIVGYYENYQAPFIALQQENEALYQQVISIRDEIILEKEAYATEAAAIDHRVNTFNACADTMGCFRDDAEFQAARAEIVAAQESLERQRNALNAKIDENNARIEEYAKNQLALGELSDAMNSNVISEKVK